ncbi:MAG: hypothetical protein KGI53_03365, partial [Nitrospirota bacterium]|nr:hypothetical protein [Nitrospirota bacterium]
MMNQGDHPTGSTAGEQGRGAWLAGLLVFLAFGAMPLVGLAQDAPAASATAYRDIPGLGSRNMVWVV